MTKQFLEVRYELSKLISQYFIFHLQEELKKPIQVVNYTTMEGVSFTKIIQDLIENLRKEFPDLDESTPPFNLFKLWWSITTKNTSIFPNAKSYEDSTFKSQNQLFFFKIMDIKLNSSLLRAKFSQEMETTLNFLRSKGRNIGFEIILYGETMMFTLLEMIARKSKLPSNICRKILYEQNAFIQSLSYGIIDKQIQSSHKRTDEILKAILPEAIAEEVKANGTVIPKSFSSVSVLFCDLAGFTEISVGLTPEQLLMELDNCFSHFDKITKMHEMEKIKTIGDSYMSVSGMNESKNSIHAINAILCGIRIQEFMRKYFKSQLKKNLPAWRVRIGIHSGPVVAGILGKQRFNYDIWGDTVNTAQRMESYSETNRINVSKQTFELTKDFFEFEIRKKIFVKGKGDMEMFFVKGIKPELSLNRLGKTPNKKFRIQYTQEIANHGQKI